METSNGKAGGISVGMSEDYLGVVLTGKQIERASSLIDLSPEEMMRRGNAIKLFEAAGWRVFGRYGTLTGYVHFSKGDVEISYNPKSTDWRGRCPPGLSDILDGGIKMLEGHQLV